jgi:hypothetical protein
MILDGFRRIPGIFGSLMNVSGSILFENVLMNEGKELDFLHLHVIEWNRFFIQIIRYIFQKKKKKRKMFLLDPIYFFKWILKFLFGFTRFFFMFLFLTFLSGSFPMILFVT